MAWLATAQVGADVVDPALPPLDVDLGHRLGDDVLGLVVVAREQVGQAQGAAVVLVEHGGERGVLAPCHLPERKHADSHHLV